MAVLRDDPDRTESSGRPQYGPDIVRVGNLVENEKDGALGRAGENVAQPDFLERFDFDHHPLVRRVMRHQPA